MVFHPRMSSATTGFSVVGGLRWREWDGVIADLWSVDCTPHAAGRYVSPDPRLFVALELVGPGSFVVRLDGQQPRRHRGRCPMSYIPPDLPLTGKVEQLTRIRHLDLHFDLSALRRRFGDELDPELVATPRIAFHDERIALLATLIAEECLAGPARHPLYGEGLATALIVELFRIRPRPARGRGALSGYQLRAITAHMEAECVKPLRLAGLAARIGLSESYFSHAFKASTGLSPHRWLLQARVRRVQQYLRRPELSLSACAAAAGFSDQSHLTRVFKQLVGVTPAVWRKNHLSAAKRSASNVEADSDQT